MKEKLPILIILLIINITVTAQNTIDKRASKIDSIYNNFGKTGNFVLKGQVKNFKNKFFEFATTGFLNNTLSSVIVNEDGTFEQQFPVLHDQQIYLYLNDDVLTFSVRNKDTLKLNWDETSFKDTFKVLSNNPMKNLILQTEFQLFQNFRQPFLDLLKDLSKNKKVYTSDQKFSLINTQFNEKIKLILDKEKARPDASNYNHLFNNLIASEYYTYADILRSEGVKDRFLFINQNSELQIPMLEYTDINGKKATVAKYGTLLNKSALRSADERLFLYVPSYRSYLYNYLRLTRLIDMHSSLVPYRLGDVIPRSNFTEQHYYQGKASLNDGVLADWYSTKIITDGFGRDEFNHVEKVYYNFQSEVKTPFFKEALTKHYNAVKHLKSGLSAPNFTLKNEDNKDVSLADFKGKVVYIDFWGVDCGPCILEIEDYTPKLHEKYPKDVVFINICVDANEKNWKAAIKKHRINGVNLIAEGWEKHPVAQAYNVSGIPHYVIINKDGTIATANAPRPSDLIKSYIANPVEVALKKSIN